MFMRYRGGGVGHKYIRDWSSRLAMEGNISAVTDDPTEIAMNRETISDDESDILGSESEGEDDSSDNGDDPSDDGDESDGGDVLVDICDELGYAEL
jgi:hypothetical protein